MNLATRLFSTLQARMRAEDGASLVEYAFLVALIAIVAVVAVAFFGQRLSNSYNSIATAPGW
ncbi:MAG TPA: Flp family type IVb pilin [Acidimicrobiia bacterium]|jgi:Flp pilus assembly pilin Flp